MAMLQGNVKKSDPKYFTNLKLTAIKIEEFGFSLIFGFNKQMDVTTHWELVDTKDNKIIDRGMALKIREQFLLFKLIGTKLVKFIKDPFSAELFFDNDLKLVVY